MTTGYSDFLDFYQRGPYAPYLTEHRSAGSSPLRMMKVAQPAGDCSDPATPDLLLGISLDSHRADWDFGAGRNRKRHASGEMFLIPPDTETDIFCADPQKLFMAAIPSSKMGRMLEGIRPGVTDFGRLHAAPFRDSFVEQLCRRMWDEAADGNALGSLFADGAVLALTAALLRLSEQSQAPPLVAKGGIAPKRLRRVLDCVEARLGEDLSMAELAAAAELSPLYFARAFRIETGVTPHRHLLERRVERAKEMLAATTLTVAEVAVACGFCDQSHLARWFKRVVGMTPAAYRSGR